MSRSIIIHQAFALWAYSHEGIYHDGGGSGNIYIADKPYYALWEIPKKIYPYVEAMRGDVHYRGDPARTHIIRKICRQPWLSSTHIPCHLRHEMWRDWFANRRVSRATCRFILTLSNCSIRVSLQIWNRLNTAYLLISASIQNMHSQKPLTKCPLPFGHTRTAAAGALLKSMPLILI